MTASKPTILFVPGAWHSSHCFDQVSDILKQTGYPTDFVELPSVGPSKHLANFDPDVEAIRKQVTKAVSGGQDVVIVAHSYGGIPMCEAMKGLATKGPESGKQGNVKHLIFCASFVIPEEASLMSTLGGQDLPWFRVTPDKLEIRPDSPEEIFYGDLTPEVTAEAVAKLKPHSYQSMHSPLTYAAWKHVPSTYIYCTQDAAIPIAVQKMMVEQTAKGTGMRTEELDASHSPMLSQPKNVAEAIGRAAESS